MSLLRWHLIVVDDRNYFALRVWRYISRTVGIQMENSTGLSAGASVEWSPDGKALKSDDGEVCFWWIEADGKSIGTIRELLRKIPDDLGIFVLVDVKGNGRYSPEGLCDALKDIQKSRGASDDLFQWEVVSSYPSVERIGNKPVRRKSIETLRLVRRVIYGSESAKSLPSASESETRHILVTGAGFEIAEKARGGFGMPLTRDILKRMGTPFRLLNESGELITSSGADLPGDSSIDLTVFFYEDDKGKWVEGFPVPSGPAWDGQLRNALEIRSQRSELDLYWDIILEENLRLRLGAANTEVRLGVRDQEKAIALHRERSMREAFRKSLLDHDWGYMNQSLVAAGLEWHAWLTTNYTKFADRAISLVGDFNRNRWNSLQWRIISTASEASISVREDTGNTTGARGTGRSKRDYRYLFKLHGDIAHLHTMAIAGHDKDSVNPLCVPVESLYQIYAAADRFLRNSLWNMKVKRVVWHIVGHGLQDIRLFRLIQSVCSYSPEHVHHTFALINTSLEGPAASLDELFKPGPMKLDPKKVDVVKATLNAAQYMARLKRQGLAWFDQPNWPERFAQQFEPNEDLGETKPARPALAPAATPLV